MLPFEMTSTRLLLLLALVASIAFAALVGVTETRRFFSDPYLTCRATLDYRECIGDRMVSEVGSLRDPLPALERLDATAAETKCHDPMHDAGARWMRRMSADAADVKAVFARIPEEHGVCTMGFIHGSLEAGTLELHDDFGFVAQQQCGELAGTTASDCFHGLGHRLVLLGLDAGEARARCAQLERTWHDDCKAGVVMELEDAKATTKRGDDHG